MTLAFVWQGISQAVNVPVNWPNTNWSMNVITHTGSNPQDMEADPTTDTNFAYDDDDTGSGSHDVIAAESPVIDLTPASSAGENFIKISGEYVYNNVDNDEYLAIEYWDADASNWVLLYQFPNQDTQGAPSNNYCSGTPQSYEASLDISGFSSTQLSGFKYRFIYNDDTTGGNGWNWGFCFSSPTLTSAGLSNPTFTLTVSPDCGNNQFSVDVNVTDLGGSSSVTVSDDQGSATQQLTAPGTVTFGPYASGTDVTFTVTSDDDNTYTSSDNIQYFCPPANDDCDNAINITVNNDETCTNVTHGTNVGATASSQADDVTGSPEDDVWFSFVATNTSHIISLLNVTPVLGTSTDMGMGLYDGSGGCAALTLVADSDPNTFQVDNLTVGNTYYLRVYGWSSGSYSAKTEFDVCVKIPPSPPSNDDCANAITLTVNNTCTPITATNEGATDSGVSAPGCSYYTGGDVWFSVVVPSDGAVTIETSSVSGSSVSDTGMAVYEGSCGSLTEIACDDDSGAGFFSKVDLTGRTAGETLYVRVFEYGNNSFGEFGVCAYNPNQAVSTFNTNDFSFYPNPSTDMISWNANGNVEKVQITNLTGQVVMEVENPINNSLNIAGLNQGVYLLHVFMDGKEGTYKLIKE